MEWRVEWMEEMMTPGLWRRWTEKERGEEERGGREGGEMG